MSWTTSPSSAAASTRWSSATSSSTSATPTASSAPLRPWLADDGALVCSIPNVGHWSVVLPLLTQDRWPYADAGLLDRTHVHFFTLTEAELMLRDCGFTVESATMTLAQSPPPTVDHLTRFLTALGTDEQTTRQRLTAYQYLLVARPKFL